VVRALVDAACAVVCAMPKRCVEERLAVKGESHRHGDASRGWRGAGRGSRAPLDGSSERVQDGLRRARWVLEALTVRKAALLLEDVQQLMKQPGGL